MITAPTVLSGLTSLSRKSSSSFLLSGVSSTLLKAMPCNSILSSTLIGSTFLGAGFASGFGAGLGGGGGGGGGGGFGHKSGVHSWHAAAAAASAGVHALVRMQTVFPTALTTLPSLSVR